MNLKEELVLLRQRRAHAHAPGGRIEQVADPKPGARGLVRVARTDAASGRPDAPFAAPALGALIDEPVVLEDHVRAGGQAQVLAVDRDAARAQAFDLLEQLDRIDRDSSPDHVHFPRVQDPRGHEVEDVLLSADHHGVSGVRSALVAHDVVGFLRQQVDELALALVAPLGTENAEGGHERVGAGPVRTGRRRRGGRDCCAVPRVSQGGAAGR